MTRALLGLIVLVASLTAGSLRPQTAAAGYVSCEVDPILFLSNGMQLDVTVTVGAPASDIQHITYTVHGPVGTRVLGILTFGALSASQETVTYLPDQTGSSSYQTDTYVTTTPGGVSVTTTSLLFTCGVFSTGSATGTDAQHLLVTLTTTNNQSNNHRGGSS